MRILNIPNRTKLPEEVEEFLRGYVVANDIVSPIPKLLFARKIRGSGVIRWMVANLKFFTNKAL